MEETKASLQRLRTRKRERVHVICSYTIGYKCEYLALKLCLITKGNDSCAIVDISF